MNEDLSHSHCEVRRVLLNDMSSRQYIADSLLEHSKAADKRLPEATRTGILQPLRLKPLSLILMICTSMSFLCIGFVSKAEAENWKRVVISDFDGKAYKIEIDTRRAYTSKTGWRHVVFKISSDEDNYWHPAIAACDPYQINVPDYNWGWAVGSTSLSAYTVSGTLARAACNW
jgi:hypothetical protein